MGGLMRGHHQGNSTNGNSRRRSCLLMVAFGAALAIGGIMFLHRLKDRRIFSLVVKEKGTQLASLQLLLQKERDKTKEAKWKLEEMRAKIYTIRAQKRELDKRVMEMQSTISSLKEEQRLIGLALEGKQNEIKVLRQKQTEVNDEVPRVQALSEIIRQKESEIQDLRRQQESTAKVRSVNTDDPTNASSNQLTRMVEMIDTRGNKGNKFGVKLDSSTSNDNGEGSELHPFGSRNEFANRQIGEPAREEDDKRDKGAYNGEPYGEKSEKPEISEQSGVEHGGATISLVETNNNKSGSEENGKDAVKMDDDGNRILRHRDEGHSNENNVLKTTGSDLPDQTSIAHSDETREFGTSSGGTKLETPQNFQNGWHRVRDKHGSSTETLGYGQTFMYRNWKNKGIIESNGVAMRSERSSVGSAFPREGKPQTLDRAEAQRSEDASTQTSYTLQKGKGSNHTINEEIGIQHDKIPADVAVNEQNNAETNQHSTGGNELARSEDNEEFKLHAKNKFTHSQLDEREIVNDMNRSTELTRVSPKDMPTDMTILENNIEESSEAGQRASGKAGPKVQNEGEKQSQANGIKQLAEKIDDPKDDKISKQEKPGEVDEDSTDPETEDLQETDSETETSKESANDFEGDDEQYREF